MTLEYSEGVGCHRNLRLHSGRSVWLCSLNQSMTYLSLTGGCPDKEFNDKLIQSELKYASNYYTHGLRPHLLTPPRRDYHCKPGDMTEVARNRTTPEFLPAVACVACFEGLTTPKDRTMDISVLAVSWYQDEFAMPIDANVLEQLRSLDWDSMATDVGL